MNIPYISGLRPDIWAQQPENRLNALQELENNIASQDGRNPCMVDVKDLDQYTHGMHYSQGDIEHIDLNSNIVDTPEPYQAVETLFHESRHSYQHHVVQNPELSENPDMLKDWQMSEDGGYIQPEDSIYYSDYRFQPTEVDARETARARTDELYEGVFQDEASYPEYKSQKEEQLRNDIEKAKDEFHIGESLNDEQGLEAIKAKAHATMVDKYQMMNQTAEDIQDMAPETLNSLGGELSDEDVSEFAGEVVSTASGVPISSESVEKVGETAENVQSAAADTVGQSTDVPTEAADKSSSEVPSAKDTEPDEEQYYGYGH